MPDPTRTTARAYEANAADWHRSHLAEDRATSRRESYDRFCRHVVPNGLVLDLGCGSGLDLPPLADRGLRLIGLDLSRSLLTIARRQPAAVGRLLLGEMRALPLQPESLDGVWADGSLHHLPKVSLGDALIEIACVLRTDGVCFASFDLGDFEGYVANQDGVAGDRWYSFYHPDELTERFEHAGLAVVDVTVAEYQGGGFIAMLARKA